MNSVETKRLITTTLLKNSLIAVMAFYFAVNANAAESGFNGSDNNSATYTFRIRQSGSSAILREFKTEYDSQGSESWQWVKDNVYGPNGLIASDGNNNSVRTSRLTYHKDHLGTIRYIATEGGQKVAKLTYSPYGEKLSDDLPPGEQQYIGQERDTEKLDYMKARYYSSGDGRFLTPDPARDKSSWSLYAYGANNPVTNIDPTGLAPCAASELDSAIDPDCVKPAEIFNDNAGGEISAAALWGADPDKVVADLNKHDPEMYKTDGSTVGGCYFICINAETTNEGDNKVTNYSLSGGASAKILGTGVEFGGTLNNDSMLTLEAGGEILGFGLAVTNDVEFELGGDVWDPSLKIMYPLGEATIKWRSSSHQFGRDLTIFDVSPVGGRLSLSFTGELIEGVMNNHILPAIMKASSVRTHRAPVNIEEIQARTIGPY